MITSRPSTFSPSFQFSKSTRQWASVRCLKTTLPPASRLADFWAEPQPPLLFYRGAWAAGAVITAIIVLTAGIHLDSLAACADALCGRLQLY